LIAGPPQGGGAGIGFRGAYSQEPQALPAMFGGRSNGLYIVSSEKNWGHALSSAREALVPVDGHEVWLLSDGRHQSPNEAARTRRGIIWPVASQIFRLPVEKLDAP